MSNLYSKIDGIGLIAGKVAFVANTVSGDWVINFEGRESPLYKHIELLSCFKNKLLYVAHTTDNKMLLSFDWKEGPKYSCIYAIAELDEKLAYEASNELGILLNFDGQELLGECFETLESKLQKRHTSLQDLRK